MGKLDELLAKNKDWAEGIQKKEADFFEKLSKQQAPEYLWIGCSDSRVPANEIVNLLPGELFVHRNVANLVIHTDLNCLSVIHFAVTALKVKHIIICGHYGCGGVKAAMDDAKLGLIDNWLRHIQDVQSHHIHDLEQCSSKEESFNKLCELNVVEQVLNTAKTTIVQDAWEQNQELSLHGWIYGLHNGRIQDLSVSISNKKQLNARIQKEMKEGS